MKFSHINRLSPEQILASYDTGKVILPPPTWYLIRDLARYNSLDDVIKRASSQQFGKTLLPILPKFQKVPSEVSQFLNLGSDRQLLSMISMPPVHGSKSSESIVISQDSQNPDFSSWRYHLYEKVVSNL